MNKPQTSGSVMQRSTAADRFQGADSKDGPQRHPSTQLQGSTDRGLWLGHWTGTSVVTITGPHIPLGHAAGRGENSRGRAPRRPEVLAQAERPEAEVAETEQRHRGETSQLAAT